MVVGVVCAESCMHGASKLPYSTRALQHIRRELKVCTCSGAGVLHAFYAVLHGTARLLSTPPSWRWPLHVNLSQLPSAGERPVPVQPLTGQHVLSTFLSIVFQEGSELSRPHVEVPLMTP